MTHNDDLLNSKCCYSFITSQRARAFTNVLLTTCFLIVSLCSTIIAETRGQEPEQMLRHYDNLDPIGNFGYAPKSRLLAVAPRFYMFRRFDEPRFPIHLWDLQTGKIRHELDWHKKDIRTLIFTPRGDKLLTGAPDGMALWDVHTGQMERHYAFKDDKDTFCTAVLAPSGEAVVSTDTKYNIWLWDLQQFQPKLIMNGHSTSSETTPDCIRFTEDGAILATGGVGRLTFWNFEKRLPIRILTVEDGNGYSFMFADKDRILVWLTGRKDRLLVEARSTSTWKQQWKFEPGLTNFTPIAYVASRRMYLARERKETKVGYRTILSGFDIDTGRRVMQYDTGLDDKKWPYRAIYLEKMDSVALDSGTDIVIIPIPKT
jgi:WD40 repeat protein